VEKPALRRCQTAKVTFKVTQAHLVLVSFNRPLDFLLVFNCNYVSIFYNVRDNHDLSPGSDLLQHHPAEKTGSAVMVE